MGELTEERVRELVREEILAVTNQQAAAARASLDEALGRIGRRTKTPRTGGGGAPVPRLAEWRAGQGAGEEVNGDH